MRWAVEMELDGGKMGGRDERIYGGGDMGGEMG